jgi:hypothetical protein
MIVLWMQLCASPQSTRTARLSLLGVCVIILVVLNLRNVVEPTVERLRRHGDAVAFQRILQSVSARNSVVSEDLFFQDKAYGGEIIDMGEDVSVLVSTNAIDDDYIRTVHRHFEQLQSKPPEYVITGIGGSPELDRLIRERYVLDAKGPLNLTANGRFSTLLYRRKDLRFQDLSGAH